MTRGSTGKSPGGELWKKRIVQAIEQARAFLILLSPNSVVSDDVRKELDIAENRKKLILPLVIAPMKIPPEMEYSLAGLQRIDFAADSRTLRSLTDPSTPELRQSIRRPRFARPSPNATA